MASLNSVHIIGRLGQDPELKYSQAGAAFCSMSVATDESYTDRNGERIKATEWHRVIAFNKQAENCANYLRKGSQVFVEGSLTTRKWQDQNGQDRYTTEIKAFRVLFLESKDSANGGNQQQQQQQRRADPYQQQSQPMAAPPAYETDSIPF